MANNAILFNAAFAGYLAGSIAGQNLIDPVATNYAATVAQATAFAVEMDSLIITDTVALPQPAGSIGISIAGGAIINPPASTAQAESQAGKAGLLENLCFSYAFQRYQTGAPAVSFLNGCTAIKAAYFQAVPSLVVT